MIMEREILPVNQPASLEVLVGEYRKHKNLFGFFLEQVKGAFLTSPSLNTGVPSLVHSVKKEKLFVKEMMVD